MSPTSSQLLASHEQYLSYPIGFSADRERQGRKFDRMIGHTGLSEALNTDESRLAFIDNLSPENFVHILIEMNGIFLNLPASQRRLSDEMQVSKAPESIMPIDIHPAKEDKEFLLHQVLATAQAMPQLKDKATILAVGINAVHPFLEGNGRIARATYYLLDNGYREEDPQLQTILGEEGEKIITPDPNVLRPPVIGNLQIKIGTHVFDKQRHITVPRLPICITDPKFNPFNLRANGKKPTERETEVAGILIQEDFGSMVPILALNLQNSVAVKNSIVEQSGKPHFAIDLFWKHARGEDFDEFYDIFREVKNAYVQEMLQQLSKGEQSQPMLVPNEAGELETWPMAQLMKAIITGDMDMSADKVSARLKRFYANGKS